MHRHVYESVHEYASTPILSHTRVYLPTPLLPIDYSVPIQHSLNLEAAYGDRSHEGPTDNLQVGDMGVAWGPHVV